MRISTRLLLIVATCLLPIIALHAAVSWQRWTDRKSQLAELAMHQAQLLAGDAHSIAQGARILLGAATQIREVQRLGDQCGARLEGLLRQAPGFAFLAVVERDGQMRCASHPALTSGLADPAWASEAREAGEFRAGRFSRSALVPGGFLPFYLPIGPPIGPPIGAEALGDDRGDDRRKHRLPKRADLPPHARGTPAQRRQCQRHHHPGHVALQGGGVFGGDLQAGEFAKPGVHPVNRR